jgi:hypothetical protein
VHFKTLSQITVTALTNFLQEIEYLFLPQMVAIFPHLDMYFCIATKWTRHLGFLITYSALLMKTWRSEAGFYNMSLPLWGKVCP